MFFTSIGITIATLFYIANHVVDKHYIDLANLHFESVFLFLIIPLFFFIWVLKLIAKRYQANFHLMNDAKNREVMTKSFLALVAGSHADSKDKILILGALFRPTPDIKYDDGAPVHWFDLVLEKVKEGQERKSN